MRFIIKYSLVERGFIVSAFASNWFDNSLILFERYCTPICDLVIRTELSNLRLVSRRWPCVSIDVLIKKIVRVKPRIYGFADAKRVTRQKRNREFVRLRKIGFKSMWYLSVIVIYLYRATLFFFYSREKKRERYIYIASGFHLRNIENSCSLSQTEL